MGACGHASRSTAALPFVEDISLPVGCKRSMGYGEDALHQDGPNHMDEVGPAGPDGQESPVSLVYDQVALAAK